MNMQKIGTILIAIIFIGSTVAYAMSFAFSNPQEKKIPDPVRGDKGAKVTIVEYTDFSCSSCREAHRTMKNILSNYTEEVNFKFKSFPSSKNSLGVMQAAECAHMQDSFWGYYDKLFQIELPITNEDLEDIANEVGLGMGEFNQCLGLNSVRQEVIDDRQEGLDKNVKRIPTFFINGQRVVGARSYSEFERIIKKNL